MTRYVRNRHLFLSDIVLLSTAAMLSFVLRLETLNLHGYWDGILLFALLVVPVTLATLRLGGMYSRYWQYASIEEMLLLIGIITVATLVSGGLLLLFNGWLMPGAIAAPHLASSAINGRPILMTWWIEPGTILIPRSIPFIYLLLALGFTAAPRILLRASTLQRYLNGRRRVATPVLVVGAGHSGSMMVREIQRSPHLGLRVVGFVDDNPTLKQVRIYGVPVLGTRHDIPRLVESYRVRQVIIAIPSASGKTIRDIVTICERVGVQSRTMPGLYELLDGKVSVSQMRPVKIENLLRRATIQTSIEPVRHLLSGRRVLITGAGGSIGSELCRQVAHCQPAEMVLVGHGENSIFDIHNELKKSSPYTIIHAVIADTRDAERIARIFATYRPQMVFHAAAHKHVPLMEGNPAEAVTTNILGTRNLLNAALHIGVERFVMISTDKAVNPTSIMGASKRAAELLVHQAAQQSGRPYVSVRFGNVLGSRGSVVHTFKRQIAAGGPITVTHPDMRRYFMTIPEAVQLVLQAATLGAGNETFVLDMGEPVRLVDLARDMIELSGLEVGHDIDIVYTGLRPGEKLFEELFVTGEQHQQTRHEKIFVASKASSYMPANLDRLIEALALAAHHDDTDAIFTLLQTLIPEFHPVRNHQPQPAPALPPREGDLLAQERGSSVATTHQQQRGLSPA